MTISPRDENELTASFDIHIPNWLPGGKLAISYRRLWDKRNANFLAASLEKTDLSEEQFYERLEEADTFADVFEAAASQATRHGDPEVHDLLARMVAAALRDNARIDTVSYLLTRLARLEPIHIRILARFPGPLSRNLEDMVRMNPVIARVSPEAWERELKPLISDTIAKNSLTNIASMSRGIRADFEVARAAMTELQAAGMMQLMERPQTLDYKPRRDHVTYTLTVFPANHAWRLSGLGKTLRAMVDDIAVDEGHASA